MEELIISAKNGDKIAFTNLIIMIQNDLYRIAKVRLQDIDDINDVIQDTMISAYKNLNKLKDIENFKSWIIKILINKCNEIYRKKKKNYEIINKLKKNYNSKSYTMQDINSKIYFDLIISELKYDEQLIVTLYYNSNYSCMEISNILDMKFNTVKSKLLRAKEKIRKKYKKEEELYNG